MRRTNWSNVEKSTKDMKRRVKNIVAASAYLQNRPDPGYFVDNISKNTVKISDCKSSTLRRYVSLLDKYYFLVTSPSDKNYILEKKIEIETELNQRPDGLVGGSK